MIVCAPIVPKKLDSCLLVEYFGGFLKVVLRWLKLLFAGQLRVTLITFEAQFQKAREDTSV